MASCTNSLYVRFVLERSLPEKISVKKTPLGETGNGFTSRTFRKKREGELEREYR